MKTVVGEYSLSTTHSTLSNHRLYLYQYVSITSLQQYICEERSKNTKIV